LLAVGFEVNAKRNRDTIMKIGVPREIKDQENRVALTPSGARTLVDAGHAVHIQEGAGLGSGFSDDEYVQAGAILCPAEQAWDADLVMKVKEPQECEYPHLRTQIVFTYFHLSGVTETLTEALLRSEVTAIAYETVEDEHARLPLLAPMSAVAGNMAIVIGSYLTAWSDVTPLERPMQWGQTFTYAVATRIAKQRSSATSPPT
jgi:alanine dehydrogenase